MTWTPPVVDMDDPLASAVLYEACKDVGFFYLENHGISQETVQNVFKESKAFFALGIEDKMLIKSDEKNRGYTPMYDQTLDPEHQTKGDTKEGYYMYREIDADSEEATGAFKGPNQWPPVHLVPGWKETMTDYFDRTQALGVRLMGLLAVSLGLDPALFEGCFSKSETAMRLLHYSDEVSDPGNGVLGAGAHSDWGLMTILATDEVPGLQVRLDGEWIDVPPRPGAFICNLGDMLERWTNDHLRSTVHRVVNKLGRERYSIAIFLDPDFDTEVVCLSQFTSEENPAKYPPTTSGEYILSKLAETHNDVYDNEAEALTAAI